jgi:hypothetical protein
MHATVLGRGAQEWDRYWIAVPLARAVRLTQKKRPKLPPDALADGMTATLLLRDFVQRPDGMAAIDLAASCVRTRRQRSRYRPAHFESGEIAP